MASIWDFGAPITGGAWCSYTLAQGGAGYPPGGGIHVGVGPVFNITRHEEYLRHYHNVQVMSPPKPYGSFGGDVSWWKGSPTAFHVNWGLSTGGISYTRQY